MRRRLLIVDDDVISRTVTARFVEGLGHETVVAASGDEALVLLRAGPFDAVFMDCNMPGGNGFETALTIREADVIEASVPIIAMTGGDRRTYDQLSVLSGMNDFIAKPVTLAKVRDVLAKWFETAA